MKLLIPVMRTKRNNRHIDLSIVNLINHTILLVDAARPSLFEYKMLEVFHLSRARSRMLLQFNQKFCHFLNRRLIATPLYSSELGFSLLRKENNVCHRLQGIYQVHYVVLGLKTSELCFRMMGCSNIFLNGSYVTGVGKKLIARGANLVWVYLIRRLSEFAGQPLTVVLRERQPL